VTDWAAYPNFSRSEFECRCGRCGLASMDDQFMFKLQNLRTRLGFPFPITSGYRCPNYNTSRGFTQTHASGKAADIGVRGDRAWALLNELDGQFSGIGINQKGDKRFIHLDTLTPEEAPRPTIWSY